MDSDQSEEEHEAISKQIVDYYRKYSQNKQLPKYFSGSSINYMPKIVKDEEIPVQTCPTIVIHETTSEIEEVPETKAASPTSSITSTKKLEWDNGADIGYDNYESRVKLYKSISLPILLSPDNKLIKQVNTKPNLTSQIVTVISYSSHDDNSQEKRVYSSSSSSSYKAEAPVQSSSSSGARTNPKPISSSSSSSFVNAATYLKNRIGFPDAQSTPKIFSDIEKHYFDTPKTKKEVYLCWTKPISVDCYDKKRKAFDKEIQTSAQASDSKCVQTGDSLTRSVEKLGSIKEKPSNQSIIIINYDSESDGKSSTNTCEDVAASQCDSFEYYRNETKCKTSGAKIDSTDSSREIPILGQLITEKQSKTLIKDVDRSIELLQKLLKSKKYDGATKKRYIRKIVQKIVDNKYNEDSTTSSELFVPKKQDCEPLKEDEVAHHHPKQISKFTVKTFNDEFVPSDLSKNAFIDSGSGNLDTETSLEKCKSTSSSYQSWKDDKTLSEKLLEEKQRGQGDQLVKYAMKERQHQISWINNEISHLTKLKGLLEKKKQQTTTVYMLSNVDHSDDNLCSCTGKKSRQYVIQTDLSENSSTEMATTNYHLHDKNGKKKYQVKELTAKREESNIPSRVVRDIEVVTGDNTTNIRVKTGKLGFSEEELFKPKAPSLIGPGKYDTFPRSKTEVERRWPHTNGASGSRPREYAFEIPLSGSSNLEEKINEIVKRYSSLRSSSTAQPCSCALLRADSKDCFPGKNIEKDESRVYNSEFSKRRERVPSNKIEPIEMPCFCRRKEYTSISTRRESKPHEVPLSTITSESSSDKSIQCNCKCECSETKKKTDIGKKLSVDDLSDKIVWCYCGRGSALDRMNMEETKSDSRKYAFETPVDDFRETSSGKEYAFEVPVNKFTETSSDKSVQCSVSLNRDTRITDSRKQPEKKYTFEIPLNNPTTEETSSDKVRQCICGCKCARRNLVDTDLQTDECKCYNKEVQTSLRLYDDDSAKVQRSLGLNGDGSAKERLKDGDSAKDRTSIRLKDSDSSKDRTSIRLMDDDSAKDRTSIRLKDGDSAKDRTSLRSKDYDSAKDPTFLRSKDDDSAKDRTSFPSKDDDSVKDETSSRSKDDDSAKGRTSLRSKDDDSSKYRASLRSKDDDSAKDRTSVRSKDDGSTKDRTSLRLKDDSGQSRSVETDLTSFQSESSSSSSETTTSVTESLKSCLCCKRKNVTSKYLYSLRQKLSDQAYPLCRPCYRQNRKENYVMSYYNNPGHICNCYTVVQTKTLDEIKKTINDLKDLDNQYCTCIDVDNRSTSDYCQYCRCKLKKTSKKKNGIAYMLTFENERVPEEKKKKKHKKTYLEEIKIKIPVTYKKKHKDKENKRKKEKRTHENEGTSSSNAKKTAYSLQEYLHKNRPDFVEEAEDRRKTVKESKIQREEMTDYKKMLFLKKCQEDCEKNARRLFTEKEMKEITKRNYKKLPEVQQRLNKNREKQLRQANRLIADTFNKKLRENVLKGKRNLPTDVNVVNL